MIQVTFIDTSILCELVKVPGKSRSDDALEIEFRERAATGERFVVPIAAIIETGNHIEQVHGPHADGRAAAQRLADLVRAAAEDRPPFVAHTVAWDADALTAWLDGDSTGSTFVDLAGAGRLGGGDVAILVERDHYLRTSAVGAPHVHIWTLDGELGAMS